MLKENEADLLTFADVRKSVGRHRLRSPERIAEVADYVRRSVARADYRSAVRAGEVDPWERAFGHVVFVQDLMRALDSRLRDGTRREGAVPEERRVGPVNAASLETASRQFCPPAPATEPDESPELDPQAAYERALAKEELGYQHDPGWRNGSVSAHGAELMTDDERIRHDLPPSPNVHGVAAYALVWKADGIPELAWYYGAAAFELGLSTVQEGLVAQLLLGISASDVDVAAFAEGPDTMQIVAASRQRIVRNRLGRIPVHMQGNLELAYTDRVYDAMLVADYGEGVAPFVWRAQQRVRATGLPSSEHPKAVLRELTREVQRDWPGYEPPARGSVKERTKRVAELIPWTAHQYYRAAAGMPEPRRPRRARAAPVYRAAGKRGRKRRQLVEVPRRVA